MCTRDSKTERMVNEDLLRAFDTIFPGALFGTQEYNLNKARPCATVCALAVLVFHWVPSCLGFTDMSRLHEHRCSGLWRAQGLQHRPHVRHARQRALRGVAGPWCLPFAACHQLGGQAARDTRHTVVARLRASHLPPHVCSLRLPCWRPTCSLPA